MNRLTWEDVCNNPRLVGGDIEVIENGYTYRGPLRQIKDEGRCITFVLSWKASVHSDTGTWEAIEASPFSFSKEVVPYDVGKGRVLFQCLSCSVCTLFPKGDNPLPPEKVKGLQKGSERLLSLYSWLKFESDLVLKVCRELGLYSVINGGVAHSETLTSFLRRFHHDDSAEEFLKYYIQTVTGNVAVHYEVY